MRLKHTVVVQVADDTDMKDLLFSTDEALALTQTDAYQRVVSGKMHVTAAGSEDVPLGDVDVPKGAYLKVTGECTLKINGSADGITLTPAGTSSTATAKFLIEAALSQLELTAGADDLEAVYCVWGDAA